MSGILRSGLGVDSDEEIDHHLKWCADYGKRVMTSHFKCARCNAVICDECSILERSDVDAQFCEDCLEVIGKP